MKKYLIIIVSLLTALLCGCGAWVEDTYLAVRPHVEEATQATETDAEETHTVVTNRSELRGAVLSRIRDWVESDTLWIENYEGDPETDLSEILAYAMQEDPIGAYAVDFIDAELSGDTASGRIELSVVFRRSAAEIGSIVTVNDTVAALRRIDKALNNNETALTLRIRSYTEADFEDYIFDYCLNNPNLVVALPVVSAQVYPKEGEARILELHFTYDQTRENLSMMLASVNTILGSASSYVTSGKTETERLELLARFLSNRFDYEIAENVPTMPAYELLCEGKAHSLSFATVFRYECTRAGTDCRLVCGERNGEAWYWNIVCLDGVYYHVDLMRSVERHESTLTPLLQQELRAEGYVWEEGDYPSNPEPDPVETGPSELPEQTEFLEPTVPKPTETSTQEPSWEPTESTEELTEAASSDASEEPTEDSAPSEET